MTESLIETRDLVKRYGDKVAVNSVSFDVYGGEVFGFLGPNGAGKTTTIKMIVGLLQPTAGTVNVAGYDVQTQPLLAKAASGYVPDTPNLYAKLTGRELLRFVGDLYSMDPVQVARRTDELYISSIFLLPRRIPLILIVTACNRRFPSPPPCSMTPGC